MDKHDRIWFFLSVAVGLIAISLSMHWQKEEEQPKQEIDFSKYIFEQERDVEAEVFGAEPTTDFVPDHCLEKSFNPYPDAIEKHIEATAYCYGTTTCTGKPVREGYAAMSKRYLGMTAVVYTEDENGNALDYIGTYEIEDTGGDERIKNGNCIDIFMDSREDAINFGRQNVVVYLIEAKG